MMQQVQPVVQSVCRGKWLTSEVNLSTSDDVVCIDFGTYADDNLMRIDTSATIGTYNKKTIIVRNGNVLLQ
ncbi:hypothetical protein GW750_01650 [bacterium]|nr:hypothetical protein [bacterium]